MRSIVAGRFGMARSKIWLLMEMPATLTLMTSSTPFGAGHTEALNWSTDQARLSPKRSVSPPCSKIEAHSDGLIATERETIGETNQNQRGGDAEILVVLRSLLHPKPETEHA